MRYVSLRSAVLNNGLEEIGQYCLANSGIREITLPGTLNCVGTNAFSNCRNLRMIYVENGCEVCLSGAGIPESAKMSPSPEAMAGSARIWDLRQLKDVVVPEGVEKI